MALQIRRDTSANWSSINPVLLLGEQGYETDSRKIKIGDGTTAWNSLLYTSGGDMYNSENLSGLTNTSTARTNLGLGNVNNTTDLNKPISTATQTALNGKQNTISITTGTITATDGQTVFTVGTYVLGSNKLSISINGLEQVITTDYTETNTTSITMTSGLIAGDIVKWKILS